MPYCPRDASGNPLCHIIDHPDRSDKSFCVNCKEQFVKSSTEKEPWRRRSEPESQFPQPVLEIIIGVLSLILAAGINSILEDSPVPPSQTQPPQTTVSRII